MIGALIAAKRNIAAAPEKFRALEEEAVRLHPMIADGVLPIADATDGLRDAALAHGLCASPKAERDVEHVIGQGFAGNRTLVPAVPASPAVPVAQAWPIMESE